MFRQLPHVAVPGFAPICGDSNDPATVLAGLHKRVLKKNPEPKSMALRELKEFVGDWLKEHIPVVRPYGFEEWLETTHYPLARKEELRQAYTSLKGGVPTLREARKIASFIKTEGYTLYKNVRLINARGDKFKVFSGPAVKAVENALYSHPAYVKHCSVEERAAKVKALKQAGRRYFQTDYTAFESHFLPEIMDALELQLFRHCLQGWEHCDHMCRVMSGVNKLCIRGLLTAGVVARRMSGEMSTSLGNGFSNHMLSLFLSHRHGWDLEGIVEGDDGLWATTGALTSEDFAELGFTIKVEEVDDPQKASFCGLIFGSSGQVIRDPIRFISNFGWTSSFINAGDKIMYELLRAKSLSALYETPACPIVTALAAYGLKMSTGYSARFIYDGYHDPTKIVIREPQPIETDTRILFQELYGISPEEQVLLEEQISGGDLSGLALLRSNNDLPHYSARYVEGCATC